jgi:integrase
VVLTDKAMEIIEAVNDRKQELGIDNEYIFSLKDQPASYDALKDLYPSYCSKLDITNRSSHKSRKTFVSSLIDGGVNINTVREMVGHNDERTTLSCYCFDRNTDAERKNMIQNALSS